MIERIRYSIFQSTITTPIIRLQCSEETSINNFDNDFEVNMLTVIKQIILKSIYESFKPGENLSFEDLPW